MVHRLLFEPAIRMAGMHDHDLGRVVFLQPSDDRLGDGARGEILAFGIYEALRRADLIEIEALDFVHRTPVAISCARPRDADLDILELRLERFGPGASGGLLHLRQAITPGTGPAIVSQFRQRSGDLTFHHHRRIVPWAVLPSVRSLAARIVFLVFARIPALVGHVDTAANRDLVVEHGDFLVMRTPDGMRGIEAEVDTPVSYPARQIPPHRSTADGG